MKNISDLTHIDNTKRFETCVNKHAKDSWELNKDIGTVKIKKTLINELFINLLKQEAKLLKLSTNIYDKRTAIYKKLQYFKKIKIVFSLMKLIMVWLK
jgi:hypothetical protein